MRPQLPAIPLRRSLIHGTIGALFWYLFYERYWRWRDCINEALSSCAIPEAANATGAGLLWMIPAVAFSIRPAITISWLLLRTIQSVAISRNIS